MPSSNTNNQASANNAADQSQDQAAAIAEAAKKAEKQALIKAKMQAWANDGNMVDISTFISNGGPVARRNEPKSE
ncbi:hypothetical protein Q7P36_006545 [Cladosporium allicinum]